MKIYEYSPNNVQVEETYNQGDKGVLASAKIFYDEGQGWFIKTHCSLNKVSPMITLFTLVSMHVFIP